MTLALCLYGTVNQVCKLSAVCASNQIPSHPVCKLSNLLATTVIASELLIHAQLESPTPMDADADADAGKQASSMACMQ